LKRRGVIPARESVNEGPSGNDLPQAAARAAMHCRPGGEWVALQLACSVQIPHRLSLLHCESSSRSNAYRCSPLVQSRFCANRRGLAKDYLDNAIAGAPFK
jgi:hypothetical protein